MQTTRRPWAAQTLLRRCSGHPLPWRLRSQGLSKRSLMKKVLCETRFIVDESQMQSWFEL
jgi:hypothetical protein